MTKNLVIVESPAKAKTIEKYLGKDFTVKSSFGHIRDLPSKGMNIDIEGGTFMPTYEVSTDKKKVVTELKKLSKAADIVWLAADEDREGEAIAWHLSEALTLDPKKTKRIVFHEITKPAILNAIENPRGINEDLVNAQQARRVLDRLVGYELSPILWKKVRTGLSAGRVQSVTVRLIVEREREIDAFESDSSFRVKASFDLGDDKILEAELPEKFKTEDKARAFLESLKGAQFSVGELETKPAKKSPAPPFTTSTLQQEASRKLSFGVKKTMMVAQKLYEAGKITYMRTDSLNLSDIALGQAKQVIETNYGKEYVQMRTFKTKSAGAQEAHEAIRPTDLSADSAGANRDEERLYDLIRKRTVASQMADAQLERTTAEIKISTTDKTFVAKGEVLKFEGFLKVYLEGTDDEDDAEEKNMLPPIKTGQILDLDQCVARESFTRPPARYTEASLVKKLEELGIGRPSTYAPTISTVQARGYVERTDRPGRERTYKTLTLEKDTLTEETGTEMTGAEKSKLFPTDIGAIVNDFLVNHFPDIVDYGFTAKVEGEFDEVAEGKQVWNKMIADFYAPFHQKVEGSADISREEASQVREVGTDPKSGKPVLVRVGRFGPMVQIGTKDDEDKPLFASVPVDKRMDSITLEECLALFAFPKVLGKDEDGEDITVNLGRFGPYIKSGKTNASLEKAKKDDEGNLIQEADSPHTITLERAKELLKDRKEKDAKKFIQVWEKEEIQLLRGPYGIYIKGGKKNYKIPKSVKDPEKLTLEECQQIIKDDVPSKKPSRKKK